MKKVIFTLNIDNYAPEITRLTYPLMRHWARKIGADFQQITERKFSDWPVVYEKLQIFELGAENDWNIYIDSDALVHPDFYDPTDHLPPNTVCHNGNDMAGNRWRYDRHFRRDGRHIGSCNWFTIAPQNCIDLWKPLDDLTLEQAVENISTTISELTSGAIERSHLIDDYTLSRNIAKFGLKFKTVREIQAEFRTKYVDEKSGLEKTGDKNSYLYHQYTYAIPEKLRQLNDVIGIWRCQHIITKES